MLEAILLLILTVLSIVTPDGSCAEYGCGTFKKSNSCQCNSKCKKYEDCCSDYDSLCGGGTGPTECKSAPKIEGDRRSNKDRLSIVSWNVDWLFTNVSHDMGQITCPGKCDWKNVTIALEHLKTVAGDIDGFNADIIALFETEDCDVLKQIILNIPSGEDFLPYNHLGEDSYTGQNPGLITKLDPIADIGFSTAKVNYPVEGSTCGSSSSGNHGCSKHFTASFKPCGDDGLTLTLIGVHLLAQPESVSRCLEREAQATVVADLVKDARQIGNEVIVLGDFNDYDGDIPDCNSDKPISSVLKIIKDAGNLQNVAIKVEPSNRYTDWYDRNGDCIDEGGDEHSMIDHILVSARVWDALSKVNITHFFKQKGCNSLHSDHWPVQIEVNTAELCAAKSAKSF